MNAATRAKIAKVLPLLASPHDGEVLGAARAIVRALAADGLDLHALAAALGPAGVTVASNSADGYARYRTVDEAEFLRTVFTYKSSSKPSGASPVEEAMVRAINRSDGLNDWARSFMRTVNNTINRGLSLSPAQLQKLRDIYASVT